MKLRKEIEKINEASNNISFAMSALSDNQTQRLIDGERLLWCIPLSYDRENYLLAELYIKDVTNLLGEE